MSLLDAGMAGLHLLFAALWTGSVLFVTLAVLPVARDGTLDSEPLARLTGSVAWIARSGAVVTLLTGAHRAATGYTIDSLLGTARGHLVGGMILLWIVLAACSEVAVARLANGAARNKVRTPAAEARPFLLAGSAVAVLLVLDAGALATTW